MFKKNRDKEYFTKMIEGLSTSELLALMQAITEYGMELAQITGSLPKKKNLTGEDIGVQ